MRNVSVTALLAGLVLMGLSFRPDVVFSLAWPSLEREQLIKRNTVEIVRAHEAMGVMHSSRSTTDDRDRARLDWRKAQGIVKARIRQREVTVWVLRSAGVLFTVVGVAAYLRMQSQLAD